MMITHYRTQGHSNGGLTAPGISHVPSGQRTLADATLTDLVMASGHGTDSGPVAEAAIAELRGRKGLGRWEMDTIKVFDHLAAKAARLGL